MKNVFKRCVKVITLFDTIQETNIDSAFIKDNIPEYRNLSDGAFKRSFERDKALLKEVGFNLEYENDKWSLKDGYKLEGTSIVAEIKQHSNIDFEKFNNTYSIIKKYLSPHFELEQNLKIIPKLSIASKEKRRVSFTYNKKLRKVYPLGLRYHNGIWYLGAEDQKVVKTFKISDINELKIGTKGDLHNKKYKEFTFTWEANSKELSLEISANNDLHNIYKNILIFQESNSIHDNEFKKFNMKTKDHHGLIKYLLLVKPELLKISKQDKEILLGVVDGFKS